MATTSRGQLVFATVAAVPFDGESKRIKAPVWRPSEFAPPRQGWFARQRTRPISRRAMELIRHALRRSRER